uniref:Major sperm protein n=1 Tax=Pristionchus pacificus TaxID=54126 RepID=A0A8R1V262_PRIPA
MTESRGASLVSLVPPTEITFKGPFTDVVTSYLKIQNPQSKTICFKVKTTAPKQYCVRPNSGVLKPGETANISVMLQPIDSIPADAAKHKFMVQSCYAPSEGVDIDAFWKTVAPTELHYGKLRVVFESGSGNNRVSPSAANAKVAQAGLDYPISNIQMILIVMAGLLIGLIVGKLF